MDSLFLAVLRERRDHAADLFMSLARNVPQANADLKDDRPNSSNSAPRKGASQSEPRPRGSGQTNAERGRVLLDVLPAPSVTSLLICSAMRLRAHAPAFFLCAACLTLHVGLSASWRARL